jgi:hypothetical protein
VHVLAVQKGRSGDVQSAPVLHSTQTLVVALHTGFDGGHTVESVAVHSTHAPDGEQAGFVAGHANGPGEPKSLVQPTQVLVVVLQYGRVPVHAAVFVAVHCVHTPLTHAGA